MFVHINLCIFAVILCFLVLLVAMDSPGKRKGKGMKSIVVKKKNVSQTRREKRNTDESNRDHIERVEEAEKGE